MPSNWLTCPQCKVHFQAATQAGRTVSCPSCGTTLGQQATKPPGEWFYAHNKQKLGPVPFTRLRELAAAGQLLPDDMVLQQGTGTWAPARSVHGLFAEARSPAAVSATPGAPASSPPPQPAQPPSRPADTIADSRRTAAHVPASQPASQPAAKTPVSRPPTVPGYEILAELGRGGMGVVYKARQVSLKRLVALKMILAREHAGADDLARFRTEAEAVARLQHPNIVQIHEVGEHDGRPYFSLEFVDGGSLARKLGGTPLPPPEAARLTATLAGAVHAAHQHNVVHRDLKPANVLLMTDGTPKIADFGLAKRLDEDSGQTQTGQVMGTPSYMAPEQAAGQAREVGPATDVYALGAMLYEMLTGRPPFKGATVLDTLEQVRKQDPVPVRQLQPKVPRDLETICLKCLDKDPKKRYGSAQELADDLGRFLEQKPILARPASWLDQSLKFARRHKVPVAAVGTVFGVLVLALIFTTAARVRASSAEQETRRKILALYESMAELAVRKGDWREAIKWYDTALQEGHPDSAGLRLGKAKALFAVNETAKAGEEIQAVARRGDAGKHQATLLLLQGDLLLGVDNSKATELIRQAIDRKLPPAEEEYARGLLAETSPRAVEHFRKAIKIEPTTHGAHGMLGLLLVFMGRLDEARDSILVSENFFPEDPNFKISHAIIKSLRGDLPGAHALVDETKGQLGKDEVDALHAGVEILHELSDWRKVVARGDTLAIPRAAAKIIPHVQKFMPGILNAGDEKALLNAGQFLRTPPVLARGLGRMAKTLTPTLDGKLADGAAEQLGEALKVHPEGTLLYLRAGLLIDKGNFTEGETAFLTAAETPGLFAPQQPALFGAIMCEFALASGRFGAPQPEKLKKAIENTDRFLRLGPPSAIEAPILAKIAILGKEFDLGRRVLIEWERQSPGTVEPLRARAELELAAGSHSLAVQVADRVLALQPGDAEAQRIRTAALDGMRDALKNAGR